MQSRSNWFFAAAGVVVCAVAVSTQVRDPEVVALYKKLADAGPLPPY